MLVQKELKNAYIGIPNPASIVLNKISIRLTTIGQTEQLTATIMPTVSDHSVTWSSDDTTVATVSTTGLVTCVTPGTCTITATTVNGLTASCSVQQTRLPSAYQEVEWIQSSGTQYINTAYTPVTTTTFGISYSIASYPNTYNTVFGCRRDWNQNAYYIGVTSSNGYYCFGDNHVDPSSVNFRDSVNNITYDGSTLSNGTDTASVTVNSAPYGNIYIFSGDWNGRASEFGAIKLYSFTLAEGGTPVRDFIPCYRIADSVIGLYDLVNDVFYTKSGTGTFTKGPDVN